ncbi:hypothetical protein G6M16_007590 [Agrobacterium tumefaciens]|nr:hypothetical protein G6M16_007590 [Agrobacterium tumefaciens]
MNQVLKKTPSLRDRIVEVLRDHHEVKHIGALADKLEDVLPAQVQDVTEEDWRNDPSRDERWNAGVDYAMKQLCSFLSVDPNNVSWDAATETLDGDIQAVIGNVLRGHFGENWGPERRTPKNLDQLEIRLQELIAEKPKWAQMAAIDDHTRMWFVAELISHASGRVPLLEIEGLVSRKLAAVAGGEA